MRKGKYETNDLCISYRHSQKLKCASNTVSPFDKILFRSKVAKSTPSQKPETVLTGCHSGWSINLKFLFGVSK